MSSMGWAGNYRSSNDFEGLVLCEMLTLMWSYSFCASCSSTWAVVSNWDPMKFVFIMRVVKLLSYVCGVCLWVVCRWM